LVNSGGGLACGLSGIELVPDGLAFLVQVSSRADGGVDEEGRGLQRCGDTSAAAHATSVPFLLGFVHDGFLIGLASNGRGVSELDESCSRVGVAGRS